jgi:hypothetical protein
MKSKNKVILLRNFLIPIEADGEQSAYSGQSRVQRRKSKELASLLGKFGIFFLKIMTMTCSFIMGAPSTDAPFS